MPRRDEKVLFEERCWSMGNLVAHVYPVGALPGDACVCGETTLDDADPDE